MKISVMQPYFIPYPGYFRLLTHSDVFVIYDCVQFPRRGYVHRNRYPNTRRDHWITLPLQKTPRHTVIADIQFHRDAVAIIKDQMHHFLESTKEYEKDDSFIALTDSLCNVAGSLCDYVERSLELILEFLKIPVPKFIRSSELAISSLLRGQDRILAICEALNATEYLNSPGGRTLYDGKAFSEKGVSLTFLPDYPGEPWSVLYQLLTQDRSELKRLIVA